MSRAYEKKQQAREDILNRASRQQLTARKTLEERLYNAITKRDIFDVGSLLNSNADPNHPDTNGITALMRAADIGDIDILNEVLSKRARVNLKDKMGQTSLMMAAGNDHWEAVAALIKRGAQIDIQTKSGQTALMKAALGTSSASSEICGMLIDGKADVNLTREDGKTALNIAVKANGLNTVKMLAQKGNANLNVAEEKTGNTCLMMTAFNCQYLMAQWLVRLGADPEIKNREGKTASALMFKHASGSIAAIQGVAARKREHKIKIAAAIEKGLRQRTADLAGVAVVHSDDEREEQQREARLKEAEEKFNQRAQKDAERGLEQKME